MSKLGTQPTNVELGDMVHYIESTGIARAAIVTLVHSDGTVNLAVYRASGGDVYGVSKIKEAKSGPIPGAWIWPQRKN